MTLQAIEIAVGFSMFALIGLELTIGHKVCAVLMTLALSLYITAAINGF